MKRLKEFIRSVPDYSRTGRGGCSIEYLAHNCLNNIRTAFNNQNLLRFNIMINKRLSIFLKSCKSSDNGTNPKFRIYRTSSRTSCSIPVTTVWQDSATARGARRHSICSLPSEPYRSGQAETWERHSCREQLSATH